MFWKIGVILHFYITNCQIFNRKVYKNNKKSYHNISLKQSAVLVITKTPAT